MADSYSSTGPGGLAKTGDAVRRKVLVTGSTGNIGAYFAEHSHQRYELKLMVREIDEEAAKLKPYGELVTGNLGDLEGLKQLCAGVDTVLHLAADASPEATWGSLLETNIVGSYHMMVAAKAAGCRRLIYASSIHAVSGYPADVQVKTGEPVNPGDLYGVTKCFGEALGRYMAEQEGLSVIALRIGAFQPLEEARKEGSLQMMDVFVSQRDLNQLIERSIDVENIRFAILHGISNNRFKRLDLSDTRELVGYDPQDDLTDEHPELKELRLGESVKSHSKADASQQSGLREEL